MLSHGALPVRSLGGIGMCRLIEPVNKRQDIFAKSAMFNTSA
jgi:hypothetical protein